MEDDIRAKRKMEISKAIELTGWLAVRSRIKTKEDRKIFKELEDEFNARYDAMVERKLKDAGVSF